MASDLVVNSAQGEFTSFFLSEVNIIMLLFYITFDLVCVANLLSGTLHLISVLHLVETDSILLPPPPLPLLKHHDGKS